MNNYNNNTENLTWGAIFTANQGDDVWERLHQLHKQITLNERAVHEYNKRAQEKQASHYFADLKDDQFPPVKEEERSNFTNDFYAFNWSEEEQADHYRVNHEEEDLPENWHWLYQNGGVPAKKCALCGKVQKKTCFSKTQWQSKSSEVFCNGCHFGRLQVWDSPREE